MEDGTYEAPGATAGDTQFEFIGGNVASAFPELLEVYEQNKDPDTGEWTTFVVVYESNDCSNPSGLTTIVGFAPVVVTDVQPAPDHTIQAHVECDAVEPNTRGGGSNFGSLGSIPGLVK